MNKASQYLKERAEQNKKYHLNHFFGENNYLLTNKRFAAIKNVISDDEIIIITNNVSYWQGKDQFVMWVDNDKIIYLKNFQVVPVLNFEELVECYLVKLNRKYFKVYSCFRNEELCFDKEDTFDTLKEVAAEQEQNKSWFKTITDKYGNAPLF